MHCPQICFLLIICGVEIVDRWIYKRKGRVYVFATVLFYTNSVHAYTKWADFRDFCRTWLLTNLERNTHKNAVGPLRIFVWKFIVLPIFMSLSPKQFTPSYGQIFIRKSFWPMRLMDVNEPIFLLQSCSYWMIFFH